MIPAAMIAGFLFFCAPHAAQAQSCSADAGQTGTASFYGPGLNGRHSADGNRFDMWAMTAAHPCLPLGTRIRVTVLETGRSLVVTITDRMFSRHRLVDLSLGAAEALGITDQGLATVKLTPG
jgi:rare lipoprotein A